MRRILIALLASVVSIPAAYAELNFAIVAPDSGPAASLGQGMKKGIDTYFSEVNADGGVNGEMLSLAAFDDGYDPLTAARHTREVVEDDDILAAIGNVGTPTATVTIPIHNEA